MAINWTILVVVLALALLKIVAPLLPSIQDKAERDVLPVEAVNWIQANPPAGSMFNAYNWGGYLIWRVWPQQAVYVDGRTDLYDDALLRDYLKVARAQPGFEAILARDRIDWVIVEASSPLDVALSRDAAWRDAYRDDMAVIFTRTVTP